jgi:predicted transposase/invertase (TIGR01784 family)
LFCAGGWDFTPISVEDLLPKKHRSPHDSFFRAMWKYQEVLQDSLRCFLPHPVIAHGAPRNLKLEPGSYVDEKLSSAYSDLLFSCVFGSRPGRLYFLVEHQTQVPKLMALRVADYSLQILKDWVKGNPRSQRLPAVVAIVLHQGNRKWAAATNLIDLFDLDAETKTVLQPHLPAGGFILVDLRRSRWKG